jgi:hypothetical protein
MATKKTKIKKAGRPQKEDRTAVLTRFNNQILECLDSYLEITKEERAPFVQRIVMEHLMAKGFYPPKP